MIAESPASDAALFRALRHTWETVDPLPVDLVDRMVAAVAADDLAQEYALLTLVEVDAGAAVRGDADTLTLQFSDGTTNVLIHLTESEAGGHRIDGWVDGPATSVVLIREDGEQTVVCDGGRFAFEDVAKGLVRLRVVLDATTDAGAAGDLVTPHFEV
ncbi:hypothetical protein [Microbacterium invictum]|uniref:Uncharacterized protein n=1 Tax=Microbacterium invictum TaxID=515415 RepID=A0AA40SPV1_9MICO|nr:MULTISPECIES: hypothetical protein [Microbacterium]MBB4140210.1 hypothetical protein [Microbacterium invictum]